VVQNGGNSGIDNQVWLRRNRSEKGWRTVAGSVWCGAKHGTGAAATADSRRLRPVRQPRIPALKVIASSLRKGNIVELDDGKLYVVLNAESFHPGKGTPTTQVDMRRISDGVKTAQRYKTTEQVERAHVEEQDFTFLYQDGDGYHFMNAETYDQVTLQSDMVGDQGAYLAPEMKVQLAVYDGLPVSITLPQKTTLEVAETEPAIKSQTAASSYKPAVLSNGVRTMVPPFVSVGTKIVVMTADGSYVERAKD
jgi:elongation factor P